MTSPKLHSGHMELAVADLLNPRVYVVVPNVSFGFLERHEADLLCLKEGRITEVEIKISASDLKADFKKKHGHQSRYVSRLVYAVPQELVDLAQQLVPRHCGIISVRWNGNKYYATWVRQCRHDKTKEALSDKKQMELMRLGCMRIWSLKAHNNNVYRKQSNK